MILINRLHTEESLSTDAKIKAAHGICPLSGHKCMCLEFREQIKNPEFEGFCHCMLYYKSKD